jgi:glycerol-3-phosphate dehydrogenase
MQCYLPKDYNDDDEQYQGASGSTAEYGRIDYSNLYPSVKDTDDILLVRTEKQLFHFNYWNNFESLLLLMFTVIEIS